MGNRFCKSHETPENIGRPTFAPFDSSASRRKFLKALAAAGASAVLPASGLLGQTTSGGSRVTAGRIDVHHHMFPPFYVKVMGDEMRASGFTPRPWTPSTSLDMMDKAGVATAMLSPVQRLVMDSMSDAAWRGKVTNTALNWFEIIRGDSDTLRLYLFPIRMRA